MPLSLTSWLDIAMAVLLEEFKHALLTLNCFSKLAIVIQTKQIQEQYLKPNFPCAFSSSMEHMAFF